MTTTLYSRPARNFQIAEPSNSTLPATPRNLVNWTKLAGVCAGRLSSTKGSQPWRKVIRTSNRSETRLTEQENRALNLFCEIREISGFQIPNLG